MQTPLDSLIKPDPILTFAGSSQLLLIHKPEQKPALSAEENNILKILAMLQILQPKVSYQNYFSIFSYSVWKVSIQVSILVPRSLIKCLSRKVEGMAR